MPLRIGVTYVISFQLNPNKYYFEVGVKPPNMSKSTVDYPKNMCLKAWGEIVTGNTVYCGIVVALTKNFISE